MTITLHWLTFWLLLAVGFGCGWWAGWRSRPAVEVIETAEDWSDAR